MTDSPYRANRARALARLAELDAAAVVPTSPPRRRNHDSDFPFRPTSDFWWLTGFREPGACLVLLPGRGEEPDRSVLFLREKDAERETWDGRRLGVEAAPEALGVDEARDVASLWEDLPELLSDRETVVWRLGDEPDDDRRMGEVLRKLRGRARNGIAPPLSVLDPSAVLHELRLVKSPEELERMRRAASITASAHVEAMAAVRPGMMEYELEALLDHHYRSRGSTGPAYEHICAGGANACILHYVDNDRPLADGDLVLVDSGAEWEFYAADITRTFPVNGKFTGEQRAVYEIVLEAQVAAVDAVRPGATTESVHEAALHRIVDGLIELGLVEGTRDGAIEDGLHKSFFMHKTGHWLGLDVHDCGAYHVDGKPRPFEPGMVLTVEPGLYVAPDRDVDARWHGIGVRIEDDVLVTAEGREVLTSDAPKGIDEVEEACAAGAELVR